MENKLDFFREKIHGSNMIMYRCINLHSDGQYCRNLSSLKKSLRIGKINSFKRNLKIFRNK